MASENTEDKKAEDEAPVEDIEQECKDGDASEGLKPEKEESSVAEKEEAISAERGPEEVNGDAEVEKSKEDEEQKVKPEIQEVGDEQGTAANDEPEDVNVDNKAEDSAEEEDEADNEVETEGEGESEERKKTKKGSKADAKKGRRVSAKSRKNSAEKKEKDDSSLKEPVTPIIERPARERKTVERFSVPSPGRLGRSSASKTLSIEKGRGTTLKDIPNVAFKLSKRKADDNLQLLHTILFGKKAKAQTLKRNISQFSGYVWVENEEKQRSKVKEKLEKCFKEKLVDFCDVLNIPINKTTVKKARIYEPIEELSAKLLEFLESPHATTDVLLAEKDQKGKKRRRASSGKTVGSGESAEVPAKKQKSQPTKKRKHTPEMEEEEDDKVETSNEKDGPHDGDGDVTVSKEEIDEKDKSDEDDKTPEKMASPKKSSKKAGRDGSGSKSVEKASSTKKSAAKSAKAATKSTKKSPNLTSNKVDAGKSAVSPSKPKATSKKQKVEEKKPVKEKSSGKKQTSKAPAKILVEERGKGKNSKKVKKEPSREEMHEVVVNILKQVDFNTATLSDILRQLGTHFGVDLMHRKAEVKDIITDVINNMSDEEEEADDDGGEDTDKEEDKDEDA
ncbi:Protein DEK [Cucurbita argyrosperma subsp. argyrosperma]|nr:Protein DEK [Cucurbita argyrosperma subsp. argyrosperma]